MDNREISCGTVTTQGPAVSVSIIAEGHDVARLPLHTNSTIIIQADPLPQLLHRERGPITERHLQWALIRGEHREHLSTCRTKRCDPRYCCTGHYGQLMGSTRRRKSRALSSCTAWTPASGDPRTIPHQDHILGPFFSASSGVFARRTAASGCTQLRPPSSPGPHRHHGQ